MEMHQVRYFLSVARTLNFTRAAEECNVSQPALTRAIRHLEEELCGELLRREGKLSHLTELGQRMLPLMQQCYESALAAKSLASALKRGTAQPLSLGLSHTINMRLLTPVLAELQRAFAGLQLKVMRGNAGEMREALQKGRVEFAVAAPLLETWDRLDDWLLFEERFELVTHREHAFANAEAINAAELAEQSLLVAEDSESKQALTDALNEHDIPDRLVARSDRFSRGQPGHCVPATKREPTPRFPAHPGQRLGAVSEDLALRRGRPSALAGRGCAHEATACPRLGQRRSLM